MRQKNLAIHPALQIPDDTYTLQESILQIVDMLKHEAPYYLMAEFSITKQEAEIFCALLSANERIIANERKQKNANTKTPVFDVVICKLRKKLKKYDVAIARRKPALCATGLHKGDEALAAFRQTSQEICQILSVPSTGITLGSLPKDKEILQSMLKNLLQLYRGNPQEKPIVDLNFSSSEKIILGAYNAALAQKMDYVFNHRLGTALYPPFIDTDIICPTNVVCTLLKNIHHQMGVSAITHTRDIRLISEPIRALLGYPISSTRLAESQPA